MVKHQMKITVRRQGYEPISIAEFKKIPLIKRLALKWFGDTEKVMVIVPENSVKSVEINEEEENFNEKTEDSSQSQSI